jgi:hypothetical protein
MWRRIEPDNNILRMAVTAYEALGMKSEALLAEARLQGLRKESKAAVRGDDKRLRSSLPHWIVQYTLLGLHMRGQESSQLSHVYLPLEKVAPSLIPFTY